MEKENLQEKQAQIWISVPEDHTRTVISLVAAGVMLLLGILIVAGYKLCIAAAILMILLAIFVHFQLQRRITLSKLIYYYDRDELFLISLNKLDQKLYAYLHGQLAEAEQPEHTESPVEFLQALTDRSSMIWHITNISRITEMKEQPDGKKYRLYMLFNLLPPYPYEAALSLILYQKRFENFEGLMEILQTMYARTKKFEEDFEDA